MPRFALVIGIDKYNNPLKDGQNVPALQGAVADANEIQNYLLAHGVPSDHIQNLRSPNTEDSIPATKDNIIKALSDLKTMEINPGEPILIYFAGHGGQTPAPKEWPTEGGMIQCLLPQDVDKDSQGQIINIIPDFVVAGLLAELAEVKGNNIVCSSTLFGQTEVLDADLWVHARLSFLTAAILILAPGAPTRSLAVRPWSANHCSARIAASAHPHPNSMITRSLCIIPVPRTCYWQPAVVWSALMSAVAEVFSPRLC